MSMELKLSDGDYTAAAGGMLKTVSGTEELLQRVALKLAARRGAFPFMPQFGSRLYELSRAKNAQREAAARQYIVEAIADEPVSPTEITLSEDGDVLVVTVEFEYGGQTLAVKTVV